MCLPLPSLVISCSQWLTCIVVTIVLKVGHTPASPSSKLYDFTLDLLLPLL